MSLCPYESESSQGDLWIPSDQAPRSPGHPFYARLNAVLRTEGFDRQLETLCAPYYKDGGRPSIPVGVYFRMLLIGYFEGLASQRAIAWRCADSLSLREFLNLEAGSRTPDHSSLTRIRKRLPLGLHEEVFALVLSFAQKHKLLKGKTILVDSTTLEADAAMRSIVRRDTGEDYTEYLKRLAAEAGIDDPTPEELARFDQQRKRAGKKKVSNDEWVSRTDPEAQITKMKDGTTHLAYKAEHAVDADSGLIVAAAIEPAGSSDGETLKARLIDAQVNLLRAGSEQAIEEAGGDKGYHKIESIGWADEAGIDTYLPEKKQKGAHDWNKYSEQQKVAYELNEQRIKTEYGRKLLRRRGELVERSFAHVCETGGGRRTYLRGAEETAKYLLLRAVAFNLGLLMRTLHGVGKPKVLQNARKALIEAILTILRALIGLCASNRAQDEQDSMAWHPFQLN